MVALLYANAESFNQEHTMKTVDTSDLQKIHKMIEKILGAIRKGLRGFEINN